MLPVGVVVTRASVLCMWVVLGKKISNCLVVMCNLLNYLLLLMVFEAWRTCGYLVADFLVGGLPLFMGAEFGIDVMFVGENSKVGKELADLVSEIGRASCRERVCVPV